jgi:hypothetical protein
MCPEGSNLYLAYCSLLPVVSPTVETLDSIETHWTLKSERARIKWEAHYSACPTCRAGTETGSQYVKRVYGIDLKEVVCSTKC